MLDWLEKLPDKEISVGIMALYQLWLARNEAREESRILDPASIARRSLALVEEWLASVMRPQQSSTTQVEHWLPPEDGWVKANVDGSFSANSGSGGCGVILRDRHGVHLSSECHFLPAAVDLVRAELVACRRAVVLAEWLGFSKLCLESDCLGAVVKIKNPKVDRSLHGPLVEEIKDLLQGFEESDVRHVHRSSNGVTHTLAKESCVNNSSTVWVESPPDFIVSALAQDLAG
jgi:ribonuclease HI